MTSENSIPANHPRRAIGHDELSSWQDRTEGVEDSLIDSEKKDNGVAQQLCCHRLQPDRIQQLNTSLQGGSPTSRCSRSGISLPTLEELLLLWNPKEGKRHDPNGFREFYKVNSKTNFAYIYGSFLFNTYPRRINCNKDMLHLMLEEAGQVVEFPPCFLIVRIIVIVLYSC